MGKNKVILNPESEEESMQDYGSEDSGPSNQDENIDSDLEIAAQDLKPEEIDQDDFETQKNQLFGQRTINNVERIETRLEELKANFYNKLKSNKLIKKQGRVPFTEHLTITNENTINVPEGLQVHDDIKREIAFYNLTRENIKKGMEILVQAQVPISRPDDYFAEMLKSDDHMAKVKSRLLQQQHKVQTFEERKQRLENKKFHKAIKAFKQQEKHKEKKSNVESINKLKKQITEKGGDFEEKDFEKIFNKGDQNKQFKRGGSKNSVIEKVKEGQKQIFKKRNKDIKKGGKGKRPGKLSRHKSRSKKR